MNSRVALLVVLAAWSSSAQEPVAGVTLEVRATGFRDSRGQALARLYRPGDDVLGPPWRSAHGPISEGKAQLHFEGLPAGPYAVVVVHDVNANGEIDHTLLRLPAEPLGFSRGFRLGLLSGMPTFEKLSFEVSPAAHAVEVEVR